VNEKTCATCRFWESVDRDLDEEAECPVLQATDALTTMPRNARVFTSANHCCSQYERLWSQIWAEESRP